MNTLVSVIIPAWNVEHYIGKTIESVLRQTYTHIEVIVVNDGSTDATLSVVKEYQAKDDRIIIIDQKNKGLAGARNTGLHRATGAYICIFDADDLMVPEKIEKQLHFLEQHSQYDLVYSNVYHFIDATDKVFFYPLAEVSVPSDRYGSLLLYANYINPNAVFFRRAVYDRCGGFDEHTSSAEDWDYWLKIVRLGTPIAHMPDFLTFYRMRSGSLTRDHITMNQAALYVFEKQLTFPQTPKHTAIIYHRMQRYRFRLLFSYLQKSKRVQAYELARKHARTMFVYLLMTWMPTSLLNILYSNVQKLRFTRRFEPVTNPIVKKQLLALCYYRSNQYPHPR